MNDYAVFPGDIVDKANVFGRNPASANGEDVSDISGIVTLPTVAGAVTLASSSTSDDGDPVGTGARTVQLHGLDANWEEAISDEITMDGTTTVTPGLSWTRIHFVEVLQVGSVGSNVGTITFNIAGDAQVAISPNMSHTHSTIYTVPANYSKAFIKRWFTCVTRSGSIVGEIALMMNEPDHGGWHVHRILSANSHFAEEVFPDNEMLEVDSLTTLKLNILDISSGGIVYGGYDLRLKP